MGVPVEQQQVPTQGAPSRPSSQPEHLSFALATDARSHGNPLANVDLVPVSVRSRVSMPQRRKAANPTQAHPHQGSPTPPPRKQASSKKPRLRGDSKAPSPEKDEDQTLTQRLAAGSEEAYTDLLRAVAAIERSVSMRRSASPSPPASTTGQQQDGDGAKDLAAQQVEELSPSASPAWKLCLPFRN